MTEQIENQGGITGIVESPNMLTKYFVSLSALFDFAEVFKIDNGQYGTVLTPSGKRYVLQYVNKEN